MLNTSALSPEVKKLFADVAKQSDLYKKAFSKLESSVDQLENDRTTNDEQLQQIKSDIAESIDKLEAYANKSVEEFKAKTETTHKLFLELDRIDALKTDLYDLKEEIKVQTIDLSNSLVDFNSKADKQLEGTINHIKTKLNNTIEEEVSKMENRVIRRLASFEKNQKIFEKRILTIDSNSKAELKKLGGEIDFVYNSITEIKADMQNYFKQIIDKIQYFDGEVPRMSKLLDNTIAKMNDKLGSGSFSAGGSSGGSSGGGSGSGGPAGFDMPDENFQAYDGDEAEEVSEEDYDDSMFDFGATPFGEGDETSNTSKPKKKLSDREMINKITEDYEELENSIHDHKGRNILSLSLSIISLLGVLILIILNIIS
ncbi:hypothetical protein OAQ99_07120 [Candidatus Kapabacteria bacterium]|nr:hypothetical protein [Candidatus Kapabacteria bacterium]